MCASSSANRYVYNFHSLRPSPAPGQGRAEGSHPRADTREGEVSPPPGFLIVGVAAL
jgi:hypothetical protein